MNYGDYVDFMENVGNPATNEEIEDAWYDLPSEVMDGIDFDDDCDSDEDTIESPIE